jgi:hypothetical protein
VIKLVDANVAGFTTIFQTLQEDKKFEKHFFYLFALYKDLKEKIYNSERINIVKIIGGEIGLTNLNVRLIKLKTKNTG